MTGSTTSGRIKINTTARRFVDDGRDVVADTEGWTLYPAGMPKVANCVQWEHTRVIVDAAVLASRFADAT